MVGAMQKFSPMVECMAQEASVPVSTIKTIHCLLFIVDHSVVEAFVEFWAVFAYKVDVHEVMLSFCGNSIHFLNNSWRHDT